METPVEQGREVGGERAVRCQHRLFSVCYLASVSFRIFQYPLRVDVAGAAARRQGVGRQGDYGRASV